MKRTLTIRNAVFVLVILVLISAVPYSLQYAYQHGGFISFHTDFWKTFPSASLAPAASDSFCSPQWPYSSAYGPESPMRGPGDRPIL
jgi:hypothetical protein